MEESIPFPRKKHLVYSWTHFSRMTGVRDRVYLADSKISVRRKSGLEENQNDEDFVKFEVGLFFANVLS